MSLPYSQNWKNARVLVYSKMYMLGVSVGVKNKHRYSYNCILPLAALDKQTRGKQLTWKITKT